MPWSRMVSMASCAQDRVVDLGRREVGHDRAVVERVGPAARPVDELVADHEVAGLDRELERARGARRDDRLDPERAHRPDVGAVVDLVRRDRVAPAVARQERDRPAGDLGEEERIRRRAVRRVDLDLAHVVEERVEARTSEDPDLRRVQPWPPLASLDCRARPRERPPAGRPTAGRPILGGRGYDGRAGCGDVAAPQPRASTYDDGEPDPTARRDGMLGSDDTTKTPIGDGPAASRRPGRRHRRRPAPAARAAARLAARRGPSATADLALIGGTVVLLIGLWFFATTHARTRPAADPTGASSGRSS